MGGNMRCEDDLTHQVSSSSSRRRRRRKRGQGGCGAIRRLQRLEEEGRLASCLNISSLIMSLLLLLLLLLLVLQIMTILKANLKLKDCIDQGQPRDIIERLEIYLQVGKRRRRRVDKGWVVRK